MSAIRITITETPSNVNVEELQVVINILEGGGTGNGDVSSTRIIATTAPLAGGGDLSADRTLSLTHGASLINNAGTLERAALTGDVTATQNGNDTTIANDAVTNAKLANVATSTLKGRVTAGTGDVEDLTGAQATTLIDTVTTVLKGLAPAMGAASFGYGLVNDADTPAFRQIVDTGIGADIVVSVAASGGSDTATAARPAKLRPGTYASAYATLAGALAAMPKGVTRGLINLPAAHLTGGTVRGFINGTIDLAGTWATPSLASGVTSGTAGAGSGATILNKPAAAANWTANDLVGKLVRITGGGGYLGLDPFVENVLRIKSNTTTQLVLEASMSGLGVTSTFEIVEEGTVLDNVAADTYGGLSYILGVINTTADVRMTRIRIDNTALSALYGFLSAQTQYLDMVACGFTASFVVPGYSSNLRMLSTHFDAASYLYCYGQNVLLLNGVVAEDSTLAFERFQTLSVSNAWVDGDVGYANAVSIKHGNVATLGADISNCTSATPLLLENIHEFSVATALTGTNAGTPYGMDISGGGQYNLVGSTLAGSNSATVVLLENEDTYSYATLSGNAAFDKYGTYLHWSTGALVHPGDVHVYPGQIFSYAFMRYQSPAYKEITAFAGGGQASATVCAFVITLITTCASNHDSVRFFGSGEALITGGLRGEIRNVTSQIADLYPPSGFAIILNGTSLGSNVLLEMNPGDTVFWCTDDDGNYHVTF